MAKLMNKVSKYISALEVLFENKTDHIAVLDGWSIKELEALLESKYNVIDPESFLSQCVNGNYESDWFTLVFSSLSQKGQHVITLAQFIRLTDLIDSKVFAKRATVLSEGLRTYFPLQPDEFLEKANESSLVERSAKMPSHHVEHILANGRCYFVQDYVLELPTIKIFTDKRDLQTEREPNSIVVDTTNDRLELDLAIADFLEYGTAKPIHVLVSPKYKLSSDYIEALERLNFLGNYRGLRISIGVKSNRVDLPGISKRSNDLLLKYWGDNASFRNLKVYEDPDISRSQVEISQGQIVDLIMGEIDQGRKGILPRDIFLTAPTGSGKSLLFQLPSFYASSLGDVVIVVSPLIALMKDQVNAIQTDRNFKKVAYVNSELSYMDREAIISQTHAGEIDILYLSPESLLSYSVTHFIGDRKLALVIIDEAHLITTWGRDFRVDYWFLGNHLRKIKKYEKLTFPLVAVTATAVYGGMNDMVFDTLSSLEMNNPHLFVGSVRRDDISFAITNNSVPDKAKKFDTWKINQTVEFVEQLNNNSKLKTLVYAPYTTHVKTIYQKLSSQNGSLASMYYGSLDSDAKEREFQKILSGESKAMICTKAFGMGIDIPDIQVVYHHAPSGHLPDYIQEVGRLARKPELRGWAALNYSEDDKRYMNQLFGLSALKQFEVQDVLKKVYSSYQKSKKQNLLISVDDFSHIFENALNLDQKVITALMMIEKDYLRKYRFNVLIARPKKLFVDVYARVSTTQFTSFKSKYGGCIKELKYKLMNERGFHIIKLNLDKIWTTYFENESFPKLKYKFYAGKLFDTSQYDVIPQLCIEIEISRDLNTALQEFDKSINELRNAFTVLSGKFFTSEDLRQNLQDKKSMKIANYILSTYASNFDALTGMSYESDSFLQKRRVGDIDTFRIISRAFEKEFSALRKRLNNLFVNDNRKALRYMTYKDSGASTLFRLGQWLEIIGIGAINASGGEKPMIFVRLNDPRKIEKDANGYYQNTLLERTRAKHKVSTTIFDHFFQNQFSDIQRWDFIEGFFLGTEVDELIEKYPSTTAKNQIDLVSVISELESEEIVFVPKKKVNILKRESQAGSYNIDDSVTIEVDGKFVSNSVSRWLTNDLITFHQFVGKNRISLKDDAFDIMRSKLMQNKPYFTKIQGIKKRIKFHGYDKTVQVSVLLKDNPTKFYKWWCDNPEEVYLPMKEKLILLIKIRSLGNRLLKRDSDYLNKFEK